MAQQKNEDENQDQPSSAYRYHYNPLGGAEEVQCKDRGAEVQTKYVQMFSRGDCAGDCAGGAENVQGA